MYAGGYAQPYPAQQPGVYGPQGPTPYPAQAQPHQQPQPQPQHQTTQPEPIPAIQTQVAAAPAVGPPYTYDPNTTYADPNVQAWAQYYAQGGKDPAGAVYFISIPGVTDGAPVPVPAASSTSQQPQQQPHEQPAQAQAQAQSGPSQPVHEGYQVPAARAQQTTPSELAGYAGPQPQVQPATQPVNGYLAGAPTSAYPSNTATAAAPWIQQAAPKSSSPPTSPIHNQVQGQIPASFAAPGSPTQQQVQSPIQQQPQQPLPYGPQGANAGSPPPNDPQYYAMNNQFAAMAVADGQSPHAQSPHPGQGVGAPA